MTNVCGKQSTYIQEGCGGRVRRRQQVSVVERVHDGQKGRKYMYSIEPSHEGFNPL